ncbi:DUF899 family protein [Sutcliffiella halmapala]|uniref:DUF899 family protein n=1 Tax=Sutcliffiella halmapala TaxID=79882 RepID=UPI000994B5AD|nr:DUF899 family protein [Sutcliffiella halmapala]
MNQTKRLSEIEVLEKEIIEKKKLLAELRKEVAGAPVENYRFLSTNNKQVSLLQLFEEKDELIVVHNMGKSCSYCTMWADGFNSVYHHIRRKAAFVVSSPDSPEVQEDFAAERRWTFPMVSTQETTFKEDTGFKLEGLYYPGVSVFTKDAQGNISHHTKTFFGPGDDFCSVWSFFDLLPSGYEEYRPSKKINLASSFQLTNNIAVQVKDYENAVQFYKETLGMTLVQSKESETKFSLNGTNFFIENSQGPENKVFFEFAVEDINKVKETLLNNQCKITKEYSEKSIMIQDPYGLNFHLFEVN